MADAKKPTADDVETAEQPDAAKPTEIPAADPGDGTPSPADDSARTGADGEAFRRRQERRGVVVSAAMDKTIVVKVESIKAHRKYRKVVRRSAKFHAHDDANSAKVGDIVRIVETRPLSRTKRWRLAEVLEQAK